MAAAHDAHEPHDAALAHHEDDIPSDEPSTSMWMPLLGGVLLLAGLGTFLVLAPAGKSGDELKDSAPTEQPQAGQPQPGQPQPGTAAAVAPTRGNDPHAGHNHPPGAAHAAPAPAQAAQAPMPSGGCGEM